MGYHTNFDGQFAVTPPLKPEHQAYLEAFNRSRRMKRDAAIAETIPDPVRIAAGLPIGYEGAYFVGTANDNMGQNHDASVLSGNEPPGTPVVPPANPANAMADWSQRYATGLALKEVALDLGLAQPGLWCQWRPNDTGTAIEWDEGEKFYDYIEWIEYLVAHFLAPWGYRLEGEVYWDGEETDDRGIIRIKDNVVEIGRAVTTFQF